MEWKKLIFLFIGIFAVIGGFIGFIVYLEPIFLYIIIIGAMAFVIRHFHDGKRVNVSMKYVKVMGLLLILQFVIIFSFGFFMGLQDAAFALALSVFILADLINQVHHSDLSPFTIFGRTYDTFSLVLIGIVIFFFSVFIFLSIAAKYHL